MLIDEGIHPMLLEYALLCPTSCVKLAYGTALLTEPHILEWKRTSCVNVGAIMFTGGTLLEWAALRGSVEEIIDWAAASGFHAMEISNTMKSFTWSQTEKLCHRIKAAGMNVLIEIGAKFEAPDAPRKTAADWTGEILMALECDPWRIVLEGRASGTAGIFRHDGSFEEEALRCLDRFILEQKIKTRFIIEAPQKAQQVRLISRYGRDVGLGNIPVSDALSVSALRTGLRMDTFTERLGGGA